MGWPDGSERLAGALPSHPPVRQSDWPVIGAVPHASGSGARAGVGCAYVCQRGNSPAWARRGERRARPAARRGALGRERRPRGARRGGDRQDRAAGLRDRVGAGPAAVAGGRSSVRDRARVRRPAPAVRADARSARPTARSAAPGAARGVRAAAAASRRIASWSALAALEPARRGGRGAAASVCGRRCAVARRGVRPRAGVRRAAPARGVGRDRVRDARAAARYSAACRSSCSTGSMPTTPVRCWPPGSLGWSTSRSATGSSPRLAATRSRCWSCLVASPRWSSPEGSVSPTTCRWPTGSSRASCGGSSRCRARRNDSCWRRRPNPSATWHCCGERPSGSGSVPTPPNPLRRPA